jgi:asparagine synthase (glutamine-hydrolysing)
MCGIAGVIGDPNIDFKAIQSIGDQLLHRGPDDVGYWQDDKHFVSLIHRRLSILDLSQNGHQPMISFCQRYVIIFNGEIYNHLELRELFPFHAWNGTSDTETLLTMISKVGIKETLEKIEGMFSFAIWDKQKKKITLARDKIGEKPLYYGWCNGFFVFASELKALTAYENFNPELDNKSVSLYFQYGYIPGELSIYKGIKKLKPGCYIEIYKNNHNSYSESVLNSYWDLEEVASRSNSDEFKGGIGDAITQLNNYLSSAIDMQKNSDVPVGVLFSGGLDSTLIASIMQSSSHNPINSFTLGFSDDVYDESKFARPIAKYLGMKYNEVIVSTSNVLSLIPKLSETYSEPFADTSQVPMMLISQFTSNAVKVAISGDGGDELFGGYNHYNWSNSMWPIINNTPQSIKKIAIYALSRAPVDLYKGLYFSNAYPLTNRVEKLINSLDASSLFELYESITSKKTFSEKVIKKGRDKILTPKNFHYKVKDNLNKMMLHDSLNFLPDDVLLKVDRAAMSSSLETRAPFLNSKVIEFAWRLPVEMKIYKGNKKYLLQKLLNNYVPRSLTDRKKMGFGMPIGKWLRGELKDWAICLLDKDIVDDIGILDYHYIIQLWEEHQSKKYDRSQELWRVLCFISWFKRYR